MTHVLDEAIELEQIGPDRFRGRTTDPYANMIGPYGGITAAVLQNSVIEHPGVLGEPIALTVNFAAAVKYGSFEITARPVRTNRSSQHWVMELSQDGQVAATATAVTAAHRDGWTDTESQMPIVPEPRDVAMGTRSSAEWLNRYEMRHIGRPGATVADPFYLDGEPGESSHMALWTREVPPRPVDYASLTAFCDVYFPRVFVRHGKAVPISTVSMTAYFHATKDELNQHGDDYILGVVHGDAFRRGFYDHIGQLWSRNGTLLATTHQLVYYKV